MTAIVSLRNPIFWIGLKFGRLKIVCLTQRDQHNHRRVLCVCGCGKIRLVLVAMIRRGDSTSCGCGRSVSHYKHGCRSNGKISATYVSWRQMKTRCTNKNSKDYEEYGKRGITFDPAWEDFAVFLSQMGERPEGTTLDRIRVNEGYSASNCRWADPHTQRMNQRRMEEAPF